MTVLESKIQSDIRVALGAETDLVLWRNSTGMVESVDVDSSGMVSGRKHRFGLAVGSADLVGILRVVDDEYPAYVIGRFVALEVKRPGGRIRPEQTTWLECVRRFGGFAAVVDSIESAKAAIERARNGESQ